MFTPQNAVEFWSVATRKIAYNGLEQTASRADRALRRFETVFKFIPDTARIHDEWRKLVVACAVEGRQVHDARLAAVMFAHGISHILTFDIGDFKNYPGITAIHPRQVVS